MHLLSLLVADRYEAASGRCHTTKHLGMFRYKLLHVVRKHLGAQDAAYACVKRVGPAPVTASADVALLSCWIIRSALHGECNQL